MYAYFLIWSSSCHAGLKNLQKGGIFNFYVKKETKIPDKIHLQKIKPKTYFLKLGLTSQ